MYTLYKTTPDGVKTLVAYCDSMTDGAQAIEADVETFRDKQNTITKGGVYHD